jgi:hypothetical protein
MKSKSAYCCSGQSTSLKIGLFLILSFFIVGFYSETRAEDVYVSGANYGRYYLFHETKVDSVADRFQFDINIGKFYAGAWYEVIHDTLLNASTKDSISQRYIGWESGGLSVHAGNFYQVFDRGLILNAYRDDNVSIDKLLDGSKISGRYQYIDFDILAASSALREDTILERKYPTMRAARVKFKPFDFIHVGGGHVRLLQNLETAGNVKTNMTEINARINYKYIDGYIEYAMRDGYYIDFLGGKSDRDGDGTYANVNAHYWKVSGLFEYKNYKYLTYPSVKGSFNQPPAVNHQERSLESLYNADGEVGWRVAVNFTQSAYWGVEIDYAESKSRDPHPYYEDPQYRDYLNELFIEWRGVYHKNNEFILSFDRMKHTEKNEITPKLELSYDISDQYSINLTAYAIDYRIYERNPVDKEYIEKFLNFDVNQSEKFSVSIGGSWSDQKWGGAPALAPDEMIYIEGTRKFANHELIVFYGGQRGGLVCAGGICSIKPTFRGLKISLLSRF